MTGCDVHVRAVEQKTLDTALRIIQKSHLDYAMNATSNANYSNATSNANSNANAKAYIIFPTVLEH